MDWDDYDAALLDLDGVVTPTAEVHMRAWALMFGDFLVAHGVSQPYADRDYFDYIDGLPRYDGVRAFLLSRGFDLPEGSPSDGTDAETVCGLGNRKNEAFNAVLAEEGVAAYPGTLALLDALDSGPVRVAVVSSSRNASAVLAAAGLTERFEVVVDGLVAAANGLPGKPAPDTYGYAASLLGLVNERCVVIEDAVSGVEAGRAGGFGLVVGVDRGVGRERLLTCGADLVVDDLAELVTA